MGEPAVPRGGPKLVVLMGRPGMEKPLRIRAWTVGAAREPARHDIGVVTGQAQHENQRALPGGAGQPEWTSISVGAGCQWGTLQRGRTERQGAARPGKVVQRRLTSKVVRCGNPMETPCTTRPEERQTQIDPHCAA